VVPSVWPEPFGQVALEAMACGRAVIASNIGGLRDVVVDGETGVMVPPGDITALREALRMLMSDPARRARMGEAGRRRARAFFASTVVRRIEQVYTQVLAASPAPDLHGAMAG
jgi:glycosyltransferase involved in cell wall biosynthesis